MDEKLALVVKLLYKVITNDYVTPEEMQALENIANELPEIDEMDCRW